jgi:hypothetical protein
MYLSYLEKPQVVASTSNHIGKPYVTRRATDIADIIIRLFVASLIQYFDALHPTNIFFLLCLRALYQVHTLYKVAHYYSYECQIQKNLL